MSWSINEVTRESGVTSRTLRHYDAIGLLKPAWTADGGRRFYEQEQLLRLQRILLLRELGLSLDAIRDVLAAQHSHSAVEVLRGHRDWLLAERRRLGRLVTTVENTISHLEKGGTMSATSMFEGFDHNPYEAEARDRWGDRAVDESNARLRGLTKDQAEQARTGFGEVRAKIAELSAAGVPVDDDRTQQVMDEHYRWVCLFWTPNREAYQGLAELYVDDERFRRNIGEGDDALVAYLRDAMKVYANARLS